MRSLFLALLLQAPLIMAMEPLNRCDVDGDGMVTPRDALTVLRIYGGIQQPAYYEQGDVDGSGYVDGRDYIIVMRVYAGLQVCPAYD